MKWIGVIVLAIIGILAAIAAVEYLTLPIHSLPSMLGGKTAVVHGHHVRGHYHKRGYAAVVVAILALGGAIYWAIRIRAQGASGTTAPVAANTAAPSASADSLLAEPAPAPEAKSDS
jgi:hypothetical protein